MRMILSHELRRHGQTHTHTHPRTPVHAKRRKVNGKEKDEDGVTQKLRINEILNWIYRWISDEWSPCSKSCGQGLRERTVVCIEENNGVRNKVRMNAISPKHRVYCFYIEQITIGPFALIAKSFIFISKFRIFLHRSSASTMTQFFAGKNSGCIFPWNWFPKISRDF